MKLINQRGFTHILLLLSTVGLILFILLTSTASFKDRLFSKLYNKESAQALTNSSDFTAIKSTTYYNYPYGLDKINDFINDLKNDLPVIKSYGFNTLWFVPARENYYTPESGYKESAFSDLKEVLALLKQNNMKAILPLTYTVYYNYCSVLDNPVDYQAFVDYHKEFLTRISDFSDISYILVFTEAFWGCNGDNSYVTPAGGEKLSVKLKATVGKLPDDLPADLRSKFTFGYHDSFTPLGWNQGTPSMESGSYDFFSFGTYPKINTTEDTIKKDLQLQIDNIHQFFPDIPLFTGEVGAPFCSPSNEDEQSRLNSITTTFLLDKKIGINIWQWKPIFWREPDSNQRDCNFGGHAVTNPDGSPRKTLISLKQIFGPSDSPVPSPTPYPTPSSTPSPSPSPSSSPTPLPTNNNTPTPTPTPTSTPTPTPLPTNTSTPLPTNNNTPTPSNTPTPTTTPISIPCTISSATWGDTTAVEGLSTQLKVTTSGDCTNKQVNFLVRQSKTLLPDANAANQPTPNPVSIASNSVTTFWTADNWANQCLIGVCDPIYFFKVNIVGETTTVESNPRLVTVTQTPQFTPTVTNFSSPTPSTYAPPPVYTPSVNPAPVNWTAVMPQIPELNFTQNSPTPSPEPKKGFIADIIQKINTFLESQMAQLLIKLGLLKE